MGRERMNSLNMMTDLEGLNELNDEDMMDISKGICESKLNEANNI